MYGQLLSDNTHENKGDVSETTKVKKKNNKKHKKKLFVFWTFFKSFLSLPRKKRLMCELL